MIFARGRTLEDVAKQVLECAEPALHPVCGEDADSGRMQTSHAKCMWKASVRLYHLFPSRDQILLVYFSVNHVRRDGHFPRQAEERSCISKNAEHESL